MVNENDIKALAELKAKLNKKTIEDMMEDFMSDYPYGNSRELAEYMYKQGKSDMLDNLIEKIGEIANKYESKIRESKSVDVATEARFSELNTILAMIVGFKNDL